MKIVLLTGVALILAAFLVLILLAGFSTINKHLLINGILIAISMGLAMLSYTFLIKSDDVINWIYKSSVLFYKDVQIRQGYTGEQIDENLVSKLSNEKLRKRRNVIKYTGLIISIISTIWLIGSCINLFIGDNSMVKF